MFLASFYTKQPVQLQKKAQSLKFLIYGERLYYLRSYCTADLRLCFRIQVISCRLLVFRCSGSYIIENTVDMVSLLAFESFKV